MILLDTHIWIWWVHGHPALSPAQRAYIEGERAAGIGISAISCWEIAKLVSLGRLPLPDPVLEWLHYTLADPSLKLLGLTPEIAVEANQLPGEFHRDPADQIIVTTARVHDLPLVTVDRQIRAYPHFRLTQF